MEVVCRVCQVPFLDSAIMGHVSAKHKLKKAAYIKKFGAASASDFAVQTITLEQIELGRAALVKLNSTPVKPELPETASIEDELLHHLTPSERTFYDDFFNEVFQQCDRDVVQTPVIMSLSLDMIQLKRFRQKLVTDVDKFKGKELEILDAALKNTEVRIRAQMESLGISRTAKLKNKAQIRSTPFCILSGYMDELERMTPEQHLVFETEERKQLASMMERRDRWYLATAEDLEPEIEDDNDPLGSLDFEKILESANIEL